MSPGRGRCDLRRRGLLAGRSRAGCALAAQNKPGHRHEDQPDDDGSGRRHVRGTEAAQTKQARATAKTAPRSTLILGFRQRRLRLGSIAPGPTRSTYATSSWVASASWTRYTRLGM